ncbi:hypothetical protein BST61_g10743 [Cercospora zeina]
MEACGRAATHSFGPHVVSGSISSTEHGCRRDKGGRSSEATVTGRCCATSHNASLRKPALSANHAHTSSGAG